MTETDKQYLNLLKDILNNGVEKDTRAGRVKSVFGRQLRFNLKKGLPLLTTKKVFTKGIIHELLWFLQRPYNSHGAMNIEYLVRNKVHIWDDDAYRWFKTNIANTIKPKQYMICLDEDDSYIFNTVRGRVNYEYWIENENKINDQNWLQNITKEEFLDLTLQKVEIWQDFGNKYRFGDLGPIYGAQWRHFGDTSIDQIYNVIKTLKENPNDRRMLCVAYNPAKLEDMALPPCHTMFQFYTRELAKYERWELYKEKTNDIETYELITNPWTSIKSKLKLEAKLEENGIPKYGLSCMFNMRSNDYMCGTPFNWSQYALLTHIIAKLVNMIPDELVYSVGDCHIYLNHMDGINEQLSRKGSDAIPKLIIHGNQKSIEDFKYEDFEIVDYHPDPIIKFPLNVG